MNRVCPKCGTEKQDATMLATETCPACGVVFSKAAIAAAQQRSMDDTKTRIERSRPAGPTGVERAGWLFVLLCSAVAFIDLIYARMNAESAPQQAAGAAMAAAFAVIPYCIVRALQFYTRKH